MRAAWEGPVELLLFAATGAIEVTSCIAFADP